MKIKSIKKIDYKGDVYNLHIKDNHNYFADNHCVSNCHELDDVFSNFISIKITEAIVKRFKFSNESDIINRLSSINTIVDYVDFLEYFLCEIDLTLNDIESGLNSVDRTPKGDKLKNKIKKITKGKSSDSILLQMVTDLNQYKLKIDMFLIEYKIDQNNWILESTWNDKTRRKELSLEAIWAYDYLDKYIFSKYDMIFLMSGTILNKELFCQINGLDIDKAVYYSIDSPFDLTKRPIYYMPLGKMSYTKKEETFKNFKPYISKILKKYNDKKGIIHTNSFELSSWIQRDVINERLRFHDSSNKDEVLKRHHIDSDASVLVSPSMGTGVSLDDDLARFQIVAKIPYPSLASKRNKLRQQMNPDWYVWRTVSGIIQMSGRCVRSSNDWADTIIIDGSFGDVLKYSSSFFPKWFKDAIQKVSVSLN